MPRGLPALAFLTSLRHSARFLPRNSRRDGAPFRSHISHQLNRLSVQNKLRGVYVFTNIAFGSNIGARLQTRLSDLHDGRVVGRSVDRRTSGDRSAPIRSLADVDFDIMVYRIS